MWTMKETIQFRDLLLKANNIHLIWLLGNALREIKRRKEEKIMPEKNDVSIVEMLDYCEQAGWNAIHLSTQNSLNAVAVRENNTKRNRGK